MRKSWRVSPKDDEYLVPNPAAPAPREGRDATQPQSPGKCGWEVGGPEQTRGALCTLGFPDCKLARMAVLVTRPDSVLSQEVILQVCTPHHVGCVTVTLLLAP